MDRIRTLQAVFAEVSDQSVEEWAEDFKRDIDPDRELDVWDAMAKAYTRYCSTHTLSQDAKREVFAIVLLRSSAPEEEVLKHLKLKQLTKQDAVEVMRGF